MDTISFENHRNYILDFSLREDYRNRSYTNDFNNHVNSLFLCETELSITPDLIISENFKFNKKRYYEAEASILEILDDITDENEQFFSNLEDELYNKIESELGRFYDNSEEIGLIIDNSVRSALLSVRYNFFTNSKEYLNPWEDSARILHDGNYLFKAIFDSEEFSEIKKLRKGSKKSEVLNDSEIYIAVKGRSNNINFGSFKDFVRLRKVMLDLIEEKVGDHNIPVKFEVLASDFMNMNIGLNEGEIKSKLIYPLKALSKIGSCREGYFMLRTCEDIARSYESHYSRWKGYQRTLEAHRLAALRVESNCYDFNKHRD